MNLLSHESFKKITLFSFSLASRTKYSTCKYHEISSNNATIFIPFGYFPGPVAFAGAFVESLAELASASPGYLAIDAHVEILTVLAVRVARVSGRHGIVDFGTRKIKELAGTATLLLRLVRPVADAGLLGEDQAVRACNHVELALHAVIESVAVPRVFVSEVAVHAGTMRRWLRFLCANKRCVSYKRKSGVTLYVICTKSDGNIFLSHLYTAA